MRVVLTIAMLLAGLAAPARADSIDGPWCNQEGKRMTIEGAAITTPVGTRTTGDYDRHHFSYVIPANEPGAGNTVLLTLQGEYRVRARTGPDAAAAARADAVDWQRCGPSVS